MARAVSDLIIEVTGVDKASQTLAKIDRKQGDIAASAAKGAKQSERMTGAMTALKGVLIGGGLVAGMKALVGHMQEGARALALDQQIDDIANGAKLVRELGRGLMETVDTTTLQSNVLLLKDMNLSAQQAADVGLFALAEATRRGTDSASVLKQIVGALATGRSASLKSLGLTATNTADALEQMAVKGSAAAHTLQKNIGVTTQQISTYWDNMVSDMQVGWSQFVFGVMEGRDALVKSMAGLSGEIGLQADLTDIGIKIQEAQERLTAIGSQSVNAPGIRAEIAILRARRDAIMETLKAQRAAGVGRVAPQAAAPVNPFGDADAETAGIDTSPRRGGRRRSPADEFRDRNAQGAIAIRKQILAMRAAEAKEAERLAVALRDIRAAESQREMQAFSDEAAAGILAEMGFREDENGELVGLTTAVDGMTAFAERMAEINDQLAGSFGGIESSFGSMLGALTDSGAISRTGAVAKGLAAVQIAAIIAQAAVRIPYEIGMGLSLLTTNPLGAANHFAAAASFGVAAATNVASAVAGVTGGGTGGGSSAGAGPRTNLPPDVGSRDDGRSAPITIVVNAQGDVVTGDKRMEEWVYGQIRGGATRGRSLPPEAMRTMGRASAGL